MRMTDILFTYLKQFPRRLLLPHRLMPYPKLILTEHHKRQVSEHGPFDWYDMNCCIERQGCAERDNWVSVKNGSVPIVNIYGFQVPLGNTNFHAETYRTCVLNEVGGWPYCP